jgi:membrane protein YqaA with SNARE-associated domain
MYDWVLGWAETPYGGWVLCILAFAESSFFPVPPDVLLIALVLGMRRKWLKYALICSIGSILGGMLGYGIGMAIWNDKVSEFVFKWVPGIDQAGFDEVTALYKKYNFWIVFTAGFTPIPYKVVTISAGVFFQDSIGAFSVFLVASTISRSARFFLVAYLVGRFGDRIKPFIDKYFNLLSIVFVILLIGGFVAFRYVR